MKPLMLITGPVATRSGYGSHSRDLVRSLIAMDRFDIRVNSLRWGNCPMNALDKNNPNDKMILDKILKTDNLNRQPDVHIHISVPNEFQPIAKYNIGVTAGMENTAPKPEWIQGMNRMNLNIVPSKFVKGVFAGVSYEEIDQQTKKKTGDLKTTAPMEVLFEGADTDIYKKTNKISDELKSEMDNIKERFIFLYTGHWLQGNLGQDRKDTGMLVKVFLETFKNIKNKPALIMKTSGAGYSVLDRQTMLGKINEIKASIDGDLPNIYLFHGDFMDVEINELYNHPKVKAHVSLTHGEGFGRPLLEASLSEKPVIAPDWSGHVDFLKKPNAVLLSGALSDVPKGSFPDHFHTDGMKWFTVNYQEASFKMKDVYKNYRKYTLPAKKLTIFNKSRFSLNTMTKEFGKLLDKYVPEFPKEVKLELPKLNKVNEVEAPKIKLPKLKKV